MTDETKALARQDLLSIAWPADGYIATTTSLTLPDDLPFARWTTLIKGLFADVEELAQATTTIQWWLADAMNHGEKVYGETFSQWVDQGGYKYGSLANIKSVGARVPPEMRRAELPYYAHVQVAYLDTDEEKEHWLARAVEEEWSGRELGDAIGRKRLIDAGRDPDLYEAERGVGRAVRALEGVTPDRWADVVWSKFLWPLRHRCEPHEFQRFVRGLKNHLSEGE